jgi:hypothetical protein
VGIIKLYKNTEMRAKIVSGKIKSIGLDTDLPFALPEQIGYHNFRQYVCVNLENTADIKSWVGVEEMLNEVNPGSDADDQVMTETGEIDMPDFKSKKNEKKIVGIVTYSLYVLLFIFTSYKVLELAGEREWVGVIACIAFVPSAVFLFTKIKTDYKSWKQAKEQRF